MTVNQKVLVPIPRFRAIDENGIPRAGYKVFTYYPGTTTKRPTWTDSTGLTANTNPVLLDANGECDLWIEPATPDAVDPFQAGPPGPPGQPGPAGPPGATGNSAEFSYTVDIDSETIYNDFEGAYIEIVPVQGSGIAIWPVAVAVNYHYRTVPYDVGSAKFILNWGPPIIPTLVPNGDFAAAVLEEVTDKVLQILDSSGLTGEMVNISDITNVPLTITLDAAPVGPGLYLAIPNAVGSGYVTSDTILVAGGDGLSEWEVVATAGAVDSLTLVVPGEGYSDGIAVATSAGGGNPGIGTGLTVDTSSSETTGGSIRITTFYRKLVPIAA